MSKQLMKIGFAIFALASIVLVKPLQVKAATSNSEYRVEANATITETTYNVKIQRDGVFAKAEANDSSNTVSKVEKNTILEVKEKLANDWIKVIIDNNEAYIHLKDGQSVLYETTTELVDEETRLRQSIIDYALSFEGGKYVWGGINPNFGVDCSGFTRYIMAHTIGKNLPHSSKAQAGVGRAVSIDTMKAGDLIFYASGGSINHVAIYIGNGKVISASNEKNGIKISRYDYRTPVKIVSVF